MTSTLPESVLRSLVEGTHGSPFDILGVHASEGSDGELVIRTFQPYANQVEVIRTANSKPLSMSMVHDSGLFEARVKARKQFPYRFRMTGYDEHVWEAEDPYRFPLQISDIDLYLHGEGTHFRTYEHIGAHPMTLDGIKGVHFAVWAPNADRVSVLGWFNRWDGRHNPMQQRGHPGVWEIFIPSLQPGDLYKFEIRGPNGHVAQKADPYAFASELRPRTASMVWDYHAFTWEDQAWMDQRRTFDWLKEPITIYEVHLGSWKRVSGEDNRWLSYRELADELVPYVKELGFTHIELLPITEHPFDGSWGYQTIGYYSPTSRFGSPDDLKFFINRCHHEGLGVILDWVPAHFPKDGHGLGFFDGTHLYEHDDPRKGEHMDWGTLVFNYGRNEVRSFLLSSAMYWADIFHIDGIRVDAVASMIYLDYSRKEGEWIPNEFGGRENLEAVSFIKKFNEVIHESYPGIITFAEESTSWPMVSKPTYLGGLGFGFKWNMGWMNDTLEYFTKNPLFRKFHHNHITSSMFYAFSENFLLPFSHDEVVHGKGAMLAKMPGDPWQKQANLRVLYAYMYAHPGKKLLFMGSEIGVWDEWDYSHSLGWNLLEYEPHQKMQGLVRDLNGMYRTKSPLHENDVSWDGFEWIDFHDTDQSIVSFMRKSKDGDFIICLFNFTPMPREGYRVGVPGGGFYEEILNTDSDHYGGANIGNRGGLSADPIPWQNQPASLLVTLPPLAAVYLEAKEKASKRPPGYSSR